MAVDVNSDLLTQLATQGEEGEDEEEGGINPLVFAMLRRRRKARGTAISPFVLAALARRHGGDEEGEDEGFGGINPVVLTMLMRRRGMHPLVWAALAQRRGGEEGEDEEEGGINPLVFAMLRRRRKARGTAISPFVLAALARRGGEDEEGGEGGFSIDHPVVLASLMRRRGMHPLVWAALAQRREDEDEDDGGINPLVFSMIRRRRKARGYGISPFVLAALSQR